MIDKLHNVANAILGLDSLRYYDNLYRLLCISNDDYIIKLFNENEQSIAPIKESRDGTVEFRIGTGLYYLRYYSYNEETEETKKEYFEEIYVSSEMLGTARTVKI